MPQLDGVVEASPPALTAAAPQSAAVIHYRLADLSGFSADPERFYDADYQDTLAKMIAAIVAAESPLRTDSLVQKIARAHGWLRTGGRIREQVERHLHALDRTQESSGEFIWQAGAVADIVPYRQPTSEATRRTVADIPLAELVFVVLATPRLMDDPDPPRALARVLGFDRLGSGSLSRLGEAIMRSRDGAGSVSTD